jgi:hypothetical protein
MRSSWCGTVVLAVSVAACGGSGEGPGSCPAGQTGVPPNCVPILPPCSQETIDQDTGAIAPSTLLFFDFSVPRTGRLDVTLDWTNPSSPVGFYIVPANTCRLDDFNPRNCEFVVRSEPSPVKPRLISTPNFPAGNYRWLIANFSEEQESTALRIVLSEGDCAPLSGGGPVASTLNEGTGRTVLRALPRGSQ